MKRKKVIVISLISICVSVIAAALALFLLTNSNNGGISRFEWMEMLCEQNGMTEYQNEEPYYTDVNAENPSGYDDFCKRR